MFYSEIIGHLHLALQLNTIRIYTLTPHWNNTTLGPSTPLTPNDFQTPQYIPNYEKICLTKEETEYVYSSVKNETHMKPVHINKTVDRSVDVSVNPYKEALTQEVDGHLHEEPSLEMKKCDLTWSILNTVIDYTTIRDNSPYVEMNTSNLYNKLQEDEQLISGDSSDQWNERFEKVTCSLYYSHKSDDTNDVSTTYLGSYMAKYEPRTFPVDNHIPFDGR